MFAPRSPAAAYNQVGIDVGVETASPHKLVLMLFEGALLCIAKAKVHMEQKDIAEKGRNISQAINIITNGLQASLNMEVGSELSQNLAALYDYMSTRLLYANMNNQIAPLIEVTKLLTELKEAWEQIEGQVEPHGSGAPTMFA